MSYVSAATTSRPNKKKQKRDNNNDNNNNKEKQRQHGPLIERYGFGKGFATMQQVPAQSASTSKRNKTAPKLNGKHGPLISHHGFGKGFATITDAPSQPALGPSLHQTTLPATYLSQAAVQLEAEGIIKQRFLEQLPPEAEPTIIRGTSNQHL